MEKINGSQALMRSLLEEGVTTIFGYPGGTIMPVYDALYDYRDSLNHYLVRHEQGAIHAAEGYARATGNVGVCFVTSGPGATNTITGIADAMIDSTPLVVISGQVGSSLLGTDAFQEVNFVGITQPVTKWNVIVKHAADIPQAVARAFYIAASGRPGPVVIDITKNAQTELIEAFTYEKVTSIRSYKPTPKIDIESAIKASHLIAKAKKPLIMIGQGVLLGKAEKELQAFVEKSGIPFASTLLGLSAIPSSHPQNVGLLGMHGNYAPNMLNKDCDLIIAIGMRFDDRVTGDPKMFGKGAKIIHMDIDASELNKIITADVPILGDVKESLPLLASLIEKRDHTAWIGAFARLYKVEHEAVIEQAINPSGNNLHMGEVVNAVSELYEKQPIIVTDVGQHQMAAARYSKFRESRSLITSGGLGTMGYGLPAAIGAAIGCPDREVILFVGDGGIQMNIQEFATIMQYGVKVKVILLNNSFLGMVRQWQELFYEKRYSSTEMTNPKFELIAAANDIAYGKAERREELHEAITKMQEHDGSYLLEVHIEKEDNIFPMVPAGAAVEMIRLS